MARVEGPTFTPTAAEVGLQLRVRAVYKDANGVLEEVFSAPTGPVENVNDAPVGALLLSSTRPTEGLALTVSLGTVSDPDGMTAAIDAAAFTFQWQSSVNGVTWIDIPGGDTQLFTPTQAEVGRLPPRGGELR